MSKLLKDPSEPPKVWDENLYDSWIWDWENLSQQMFSDLDRPRGDLYREAIEFKRAELREWCGRLLNKLQGTEDRSSPRTILFSLPIIGA